MKEIYDLENICDLGNESRSACVSLEANSFTFMHCISKRIRFYVLE